MVFSLLVLVLLGEKKTRDVPAPKPQMEKVPDNGDRNGDTPINNNLNDNKLPENQKKDQTEQISVPAESKFLVSVCV